MNSTLATLPEFLGPQAIHMSKTAWFGSVAGVIVLLYLLDFLFAPALGTDKNGRYFFFHIFVNLTVVIGSWPDLMTVIFDTSSPRLFSGPPASDIPIIVIWALHLYHILAFQPLPFIDWAHHLTALFIVELAPLFYGGALANYGNFFACGLPGGIDYVLLFLMKRGLVQPLTEKRLALHLGLWVRCPGILLSCWELMKNFIRTGNLISLACTLLGFWNALFFLERVIGSYHRHLESQRWEAILKAEGVTLKTRPRVNLYKDAKDAKDAKDPKENKDQ